MFLPNRYGAYIPSLKLTDYLLSTIHVIGKSKAKFFNAVGFTLTSAPLLEAALLEIAHSGPVVQSNDGPYGVKYVIDGTLETPQGQPVTVCTIWIVESGEDRPRFVTAYPT